MTDRQLLLQIWDEMWGSYTWIPAWAQSFSDLSPQQAAWKSNPSRKSIWQHLNHVAFWRETTVNKIAGKPPSEEVVQKSNFEEPAQVTDVEWKTALQRLEKSHQLIQNALADENIRVEKLRYLLPHDSYHLGQVMCLRALQGLPPIG